jgi:formylglycine-generating enzyme required for sulfatase activity
MSDFYQETLREIVVQFGRGVCNDPARLKGLLGDYLGGHAGAHQPRINILLLALAERVPQQLLAGGAPGELLRQRLAARLQADLAMTAEAAAWAVHSWALALGLETGPAPAAAAPSPPPLTQPSPPGKSVSTQPQGVPARPAAPSAPAQVPGRAAPPPAPAAGSPTGGQAPSAGPTRKTAPLGRTSRGYVWAARLWPVAVLVTLLAWALWLHTTAPGPRAGPLADGAGAKASQAPLKLLPPALKVEAPSAVSVDEWQRATLEVKVRGEAWQGPWQLRVSIDALPESVRARPAQRITEARDSAPAMEVVRFELEASGVTKKVIWAARVVAEAGPLRVEREVWVVARPAKEVTNSLGMKLVRVPKGKFIMGSPPTEAVREDNEPEHEVEFTRPFYLGKYEVTRGEFAAFVKATGYRTDAEHDGQGGGVVGADGYKPDYTWRSPGWEQTERHPVVNVSWNDAVAFCDWLSRKEGKTYRLPTEAEWEYSCRAGTRTRFHSGEDDETLAQVANVADASGKRRFPHWTWAIKADDGYAFTAPVGQFRANDFGLHDMHGNVWEWCQDCYAAAYYKSSPRNDPQGPDLGGGAKRVLRGGGWNDCPRFYHRSAFRGGWHGPTFRTYNTGFRVVLDVAPRASRDEAVWYNTRAHVWLARKEYAKALADYDRTLRLNPGYARAYYNRALVRRLKKEYVGALSDYGEALRLNPKDVNAYNMQAWLLATCPDPSLRDGKRAVESAKRACELSGWKYAHCLDTLAAAFAELGDFAQAVQFQRQALEVGGPNLDQGYRRRLELYEAGKPYRLE